MQGSFGRLASALGVALAALVLTAAAAAGGGKSGSAPGHQNDTTAPGNTENAPGQQTKAAAATEEHGKSAVAPGHTKQGKAATPARGKSAEAKAKPKGRPVSLDEPARGRSTQAHHHVIVCHATGSASNPYVVINIPMTAWTSAHDRHQDGRDFILKDPASRTGTKDGFSKADCVQPAPQQAGAQQAAPPAAKQPREQSGVAGVQGAEARPAAVRAARRPAPQGAVLGALGAVEAGDLPFTGLPLWIAVVAGIGLVGAGLGARRAMR